MSFRGKRKKDPVTLDSGGILLSVPEDGLYVQSDSLSAWSDGLKVWIDSLSAWTETPGGLGKQAA